MSKLWRLVEDRLVSVTVSPFILEELRRNLVKKADFTPDEALELITILTGVLHVVEPQESIHIIKTKESDNRILECALEAKAQVLVTGDLRDIRPLNSFKGIAILTPREFLDKYFSAPDQS